MKLITLVDNTPSADGLAGEHGFSLALYLDDGSLWLWDAGASDLSARNARALGIDISAARGLALSHGHYDHTGGVAAFIREGFTGPIIAHAHSAIPRWHIEPGGLPRFIGWGDHESVREMVQPVRGVRVLAADCHGNPLLTMVTDIPRLPGNAEHVQGFFLDQHGGEPDPVRDDGCLVLHTRRGRVLVLGCCHSGLANTLAAVEEATAGGGENAGFACVLGGLHLRDVEDARDARIVQTLQVLAEHGVQSVRPGHCTGALGTRIMAASYSGILEPLRVGQEISFD